MVVKFQTQRKEALIHNMSNAYGKGNMKLGKFAKNEIL